MTQTNEVWTHSDGRIRVLRWGKFFEGKTDVCVTWVKFYYPGVWGRDFAAYANRTGLQTATNAALSQGSTERWYYSIPIDRAKERAARFRKSALSQGFSMIGRFNI